ncbi:hypothetical protein BDV23DRAFT_164480 [Aspergillus alliaceus]|uniref:Uncharacterized protein n=1 Tax=Petromyces alliaceus TaxID=209559 RepID=A0A5N6FNU3_PETAA|nr:uncharacterized protein BDW43DRAFT_313657 [Aspergillus alliaceus]KAB8230855.1 hypothetical protein BDW43DRAFT_313657 [Aspergillus alliaceus]KAE8385754.1 hypothetical protein BDV23DRAFT_164480 [Aspergillus alliaceus]
MAETMGSIKVTDLETYYNVVGGANYAVFNFRDFQSRQSEIDRAYDDLASYAYSDTVAFYEVDVSGYKDISEYAKVERPTLILYKDGKEVERYCKPRPRQLEYLVSRALCGLTEITGGLS